jgi:hypothetical protein
MSDNNYQDYKSQIDVWASMWDEMDDDKIHPPLQKPERSDFASKIFGNQDFENDDQEEEDPGLIQEAESVTQNPVRVNTAGRDDKHPEPCWVKEDLLSEIEKLKNSLFDMENKLARMGQPEKKLQKSKNQKDQDVLKKIESIRKDIDDLSDKLGIGKQDVSLFAVKK